MYLVNVGKPRFEHLRGRRTFLRQVDEAAHRADAAVSGVRNYLTAYVRAYDLWVVR